METKAAQQPRSHLPQGHRHRWLRKVHQTPIHDLLTHFVFSFAGNSLAARIINVARLPFRRAARLPLLKKKKKKEKKEPPSFGTFKVHIRVRRFSKGTDVALNEAAGEITRDNENRSRIPDVAFARTIGYDRFPARAKESRF